MVSGLGPAASASEIAYEEHVRFDALPAGAVQPPPPASGPDLRAWRYAALQNHAVLWGPVPAAEAARIAGAPAGCESVLLAPAVPFALHQDVVDLIPPSVKPLPTDTAETLAARLSESDFLDDIHFKAAGHGRGGRYVQINKTQYPQPRRVTWSVQLPEQMLYAYTQYGRKPTDFRCRPMPLAVYKLGRHLWHIALPYLGSQSRLHPPTACQLMLCKPPHPPAACQTCLPCVLRT